MHVSPPAEMQRKNPRVGRLTSLASLSVHDSPQSVGSRSMDSSCGGKDSFVEPDSESDSAAGDESDFRPSMVEEEEWSDSHSGEEWGDEDDDSD